ncbi:TPA: hypothetical protein U1W01_001751 [Streptococcus suis]|nr:hypothetical protein [Streptococcus suis]NQM49776.1 hypothetical protein [Streptococcus suis]HEL1613125.1 hypothetical protein [Streptococcus suis]HEM4071338.1 hypothetical protein [Streptococcus suis]
MILTDEHYNWLSEQSYWVDSEKEDKDYTPKEDNTYYYDNDNKSLGQFQVLAVEDNTVNGMQAMAVAPVVDGKVDTTQITIGYAGTNIGDGKDLQTDLNSVIGGQNYFETAPQLPSDSQVDSALAGFAAGTINTVWGIVSPDTKNAFYSGVQNVLDDGYDFIADGVGKAVKGTWNSVTSWFGGGAKYA